VISADIVITIITFVVLIGLIYYLDNQYDILGGNFNKVVLFLGGIFVSVLTYLSFSRKSTDLDTSEEEENIKELKDEIYELDSEKEEHREEIDHLEKEAEKSQDKTNNFKQGYEDAQKEFDKKQEEKNNENQEKSDFDDSDDAADFIDDILSKLRKDN